MKRANVVATILSIVVVSVLFSVVNAACAEEKPGLQSVWLVGKMNGGYSDFTGKSAREWMSGYADSFGKGFDITAGKKLEKDAFPAIQAGPGAKWAGGKTYPLRVHFSLKDVAAGGYILTAALSGVSSAGGATLVVEANGKSQSHVLAAGKGDGILDTKISNELSKSVFFIPAASLLKGDNVISLTVSAGQWIIYDYVALEAVADPNRAVMKDFAVSVPPFLAKRGKALVHVLNISCFYIGKSGKGSVITKIGGKEIKESINIQPGTCDIKATLPEQTKAVKAEVRVEVGGAKIASASVDIAPVRHLTITLIPQSHLDIGYPDLQPNIMLSQRAYLENALSVIEEKHAVPMTWVAEASWPEWTAMHGVGPYEEYGDGLMQEPLTKTTPEWFWKQTTKMTNVAFLASVSTSSGAVDTLNERRAVDSSPIGWVSGGPVKGAWVLLDFKSAHKVGFVAVRNGREDENKVKTVKVTFIDKAGKSEAKNAELLPNRERSIVETSLKDVKSIRVEIVSANDNERQAGFMEIEAWEKTPIENTQKRLLRAMRSGRVEVTGLYMNFLTQLLPTEWFIRSMLRSQEVAAQAGVPVRTAMITDVPGYTFGMPDVLAGSGIKYFYTGINPDHAPTVLEGMPRAFWWEGPAGGKVMVFRSFNTYFGESMNYGYTRSADEMEQKIPEFLTWLDLNDYAYDRLPIHTLGDVTDDGPIAEKLPEVVADWNSRWEYPKVTIGTPTKFFEGFEKKYGKTLPLMKGDWTGYWEDGEASSAAETITIRNVHHNLLLAGAFVAVQERINGKSKETRQLDETVKKVEEDLYLYDEHTWGADMSVSNPDNPQTLSQWFFKKEPAVEAGIFMGDEYVSMPLLPRLLRPLIAHFAPKPKHENAKEIAVMNYAGEARSGYVETDIKCGDDNKDKGGAHTVHTAKIADAETGKDIDSLILDLSSLPTVGECSIQFKAENVPPMGVRFYEFYRQSEAPQNSTDNDRETVKGVLENSYFKIVVDENTGEIKSLYDKELGKELVDSSKGYGINEFIYVPSKNNSEQMRITGAKLDRMDSIDFGFDIAPMHTDNHYSDLIIAGKTKNVEISQTIRLFKNEKRIEFINNIKKDSTLDKEGVYFAFPFNVPGGEVRMDTTGGVMSLEKDQTPGACRDYISIQDGLGVVGPEYSVLLSTPDAPLIVPNSIHTLEFVKKLDPTNTAVFSYIMNNYWHTNYKASQGGDFTFRYYLTSVKGQAKDSDIVKFGEDNAAPMQVFVVGNDGKGKAGSISFLSVDQPNVRLLGLKKAEDGKGLIVRLQEMDGKATTVKIRMNELLKIKSAAVTNLVEKDERKAVVKKQGGDAVVEERIGARGYLTIRVW